MIWCLICVWQWVTGLKLGRDGDDRKLKGLIYVRCSFCTSHAWFHDGLIHLFLITCASEYSPVHLIQFGHNRCGDFL